MNIQEIYRKSKLFIVYMSFLSTKLISNHVPNHIPDQLNSNDTVIYCFAHHYTNIPEMIHTIQNLNKNQILFREIPVYIVENRKTVSGVSTYEENREIYKNAGIHVRPIPYDEDIIHTRIESERVCGYFLSLNKKNIVLIAPKFHIVRATMTFISAYLDYKEKHELQFTVNVYWDSLEKEQIDMNKIVISHQGKTVCTYKEMMKLEEERIVKYKKKGDIKNIVDI